MIANIAYVLNLDGKALMPTHPAIARRLLKRKDAIIKTLKPFTLQLTYQASSYTSPLIIGVDAGYLNIGLSVISPKKELFSGVVKLLTNMSSRLQDRLMYRRIRKQRLRYRKPRFKNRRIDKSWLAPSIQHKLDSHVRIIQKITSVLPITKARVEVANFDIQKIKNPNIAGKAYQQGPTKDFWNLREYILHRDNHQYQNPNCKNKDIQIHHIIFRNNGETDTPTNLITLCSKCHTTDNHKPGKLLDQWQNKKPKIRSFKDATFMSTVRWKLTEILKSFIDHVEVTFGYLTKSFRIKRKMTKSHANDAFVICKPFLTIQKVKKTMIIKQIRHNNRSLERFYDAKYIDRRTGEKVKTDELNSGRRTRNKNLNSENLKIFRGPKLSKGKRAIRDQRSLYQPRDLVKYQQQVFQVKGSHCKGTRIILHNSRSVPIKHIKPYLFKQGFHFNHGISI